LFYGPDLQVNRCAVLIPGQRRKSPQVTAAIIASTVCALAIGAGAIALHPFRPPPKLWNQDQADVEILDADEGKDPSAFWSIGTIWR
jgi:hypothetical protein